MHEYIIYYTTYKDIIVYIGMGLKGREAHTTSGTSHSYGLNKLHFTDPNNVKTKLLTSFETREEALLFEQKLVLEFKPSYNTEYLWKIKERYVCHEEAIQKYLTDILVSKERRTVSIDKKETYNKDYLMDLKSIALKPSVYAHLITINEDVKLNKVGDDNYALSKTKLLNNPSDLEVLRKHLRNFFTNKASAPSTKERVWTTYNEISWMDIGDKNDKSTYHRDSVQTRDLSQCRCVAYLENYFMTPDHKNLWKNAGVAFDEDMHALNEMIQFIWRSAIRNNEPINLYIPSKRMRTFLNNWLDDEYEITKE